MMRAHNKLLSALFENPGPPAASLSLEEIFRRKRYQENENPIILTIDRWSAIDLEKIAEHVRHEMLQNPQRSLVVFCDPDERVVLVHIGLGLLQGPVRIGAAWTWRN